MFFSSIQDTLYSVLRETTERFDLPRVFHSMINLFRHRRSTWNFPQQTTVRFASRREDPSRVFEGSRLLYACRWKGITINLMQSRTKTSYQTLNDCFKEMIFSCILAEVVTYSY